MKSFSDLFLNIRVRTGKRRNFLYQCFSLLLSLFLTMKSLLLQMRVILIPADGH